MECLLRLEKCVHITTMTDVSSIQGFCLLAYGCIVCQKIWPKCPKLDDPAYKYAQDKMAGIHVRQKIVSVRFDNHSALHSLWFVCQFGQSGFTSLAVNHSIIIIHACILTHVLLLTRTTYTSWTLRVGLKLRWKSEGWHMKTPKINTLGVP